MKKTLLISGVLLALTATVASAAGVNLYWNGCSLDPGVTTNKNFACTANTGNSLMTASYDPPAGLTLVNGNNLILDLQSASDPLPLWWDFKNAGTCRSTSLSANSVFAGANCVDAWAGQGTSGVTAYLTTGTNRRRIGGSISVPGPAAGPQPDGSEYYSLNFVINNAKTVGTGACAGCLDPVCVVLNEILITQPAGTPGESPKVNTPLASNYVTWQGGVIGAPGCPQATPTINKTWGQVKSIYR
jgi:hypothetical protein